jgi:hypothetical protein
MVLAGFSFHNISSSYYLHASTISNSLHFAVGSPGMVEHIPRGPTVVIQIPHRDVNTSRLYPHHLIERMQIICHFQTALTAYPFRDHCLRCQVSPCVHLPSFHLISSNSCVSQSPLRLSTSHSCATPVCDAHRMESVSLPHCPNKHGFSILIPQFKLTRVKIPTAAPTNHDAERTWLVGANLTRQLVLTFTGLFKLN